MILNEIFKAIGILIAAGIIAYIYNTVIHSQKEWKKLLPEGFVWCVVGSFFLTMSLGRPTCTDQEYDPRGTVCNEYADDGYEPTDEQYVDKFAYYLTLFFVPVLYGINQRPKLDA